MTGFAKRLLTLRRQLAEPKSLARNAAMLSGATAVAQALSFLAAPILTRLYSPEEMAYLGVFSAVLGILLPLAGLKLENAIALPKSDEDAFSLTIFTIGVNVAFCVAVTAFSAAYGFPLNEWLGGVSLDRYWWLVPVAIGLGGLWQTLSMWMIRGESFPVLAKARLAQSASGTAFQLGAGYLGFGVLGLLVSQVLAVASGLGSLVAAAASFVRKSGYRFRWTCGRAQASRYRRFAVVAAPSTFLNVIAWQVPALVLPALFAPQVLGYYTLVQRVGRLPSELVARSVSDVFLGRAATLARTDVNECRRLYLSLMKKLSLMGGLAFLAPAAIAPFVFGPVFGEEWAEAGIIFSMMALPFWAQFVVSSLSQITNVLEKLGTQLAWDFFRFAAIGAVFWTAKASALSPRLTIASYSIVMTMTYGILVLIHLRILNPRRSPT